MTLDWLSDGWNWFLALEWSRLDNIFSALAAVTVIAGIVWAAIKFGLNPLAARLGRRRAQAKLLDKLACGSSVPFVESVFGVAQFVDHKSGHERRTYQLPGAWVLVEIRDHAVYSYAITITNRKMHYNTKRLTFDIFNIKLGKDKFPPRPEMGFEREHLWSAVPARTGYTQSYSFRYSGVTLYYHLSYNQAGAGGIGFPMTYCDIVNSADTPEDQCVEASSITANTLTVVSSEAISSEGGQYPLAVDEADVRFARTVKPPTTMNFRQRLGYRRYRIKLAAKKVWRWIWRF
ncbi:hypothetical protein MDOR_10190 [Mycolicibacterium doricum]|uniref:Uncharacterized protein n=1 Tax=Mycolicibacterium doricum TaxID=126673 RepID=A0A7I7VP99_9MYCO|nr:ETEC_3214 domain-containing protein [Mycolicibacterium doricum]MCV7266697.1 hypothetical protein [Mycolicibacterium doricum]BBZ06850.1 hypothetical protein MDOR_10190 [Mycolicibacterium doricum]